MVNSGLYSRILVLDIMLGQHIMPLQPGHGVVKSGPILVAAGALRV
jgi:hypothetical protein